MESNYFNPEEIYQFTDVNGKDIDFNFIEDVFVGDKHYAFFAPCENQEGLDTDEVIGFIVEDGDDDSFTLKPVETEQELNAAFDEFIKKINEIEDTCECDCEDECNCGCHDGEECTCDSDDDKCTCDKK